MGALFIVHEFEWKMDLCEGGYTVHRLVEAPAKTQRWGWIVNAGARGWTAHVGNWGQGEELAIPQQLTTFESADGQEALSRAKAWVEQEIARWWKEYGD